MEYINLLPEYQTPFYAPVAIGKVIISGEDNDKAEAVMQERFKKLIAADMVEVKKESSNAWRTVFNVSLTSNAQNICDTRRTNDEFAYMPVCTMKPVRLISTEANSDSTVLCKFVIEQQNITIFGDHLGFKPLVEHEMSHLFVKKN